MEDLRYVPSTKEQKQQRQLERWIQFRKDIFLSRKLKSQKKKNPMAFFEDNLQLDMSKEDIDLYMHLGQVAETIQKIEKGEGEKDHFLNLAEILTEIE